MKYKEIILLFIILFCYDGIIMHPDAQEFLCKKYINSRIRNRNIEPKPFCMGKST